MKTLAEYTNRNKNRVDEAISKGVIDMDAVQKQMRSIVSYFNTHALGLAERQLKATKKYLETANDRHVQQVVEDWMKKKGINTARHRRSRVTGRYIRSYNLRQVAYAIAHHIGDMGTKPKGWGHEMAEKIFRDYTFILGTNIARMMDIEADFTIKGLRHIGAGSFMADGYSSTWINGDLTAMLACKDLEEGGTK